MDEHPGPQDPLGQVGVRHRPGSLTECDQQVQPGGDALHAGLGQVLAQRAQQRVTPAALPLADGPDVLFEFPARDEVGQHELRQRGTAEVAGVLGLDQLRVQPGRRDQPAQAHARGQRLGRAAGVGDLAGSRGLQGGHRRPVVAVLRVVVVLDDQRIGRGGPVEQLTAPPRGERDPGRELVSGREQHRLQAGARQVVHHQPLLVHRYRYRAQAPVGELVAGPARTRVLDGDPALRPCLQRPGQPLGQQGEGLGHPGDDDDVVGLRAQAAGAREPARQLLAQPLAAPRIPVAEVGDAGLFQHRPFGAQPGGPGEPGEVGYAGGEVNLGPRPPALRKQRGLGPLRSVRGPGRERRPAGHRHDPGPCPRARADQAFIGEPLVGLDDNAARDPEVIGERPGGGHERAGLQPPVDDRRPDGVG